MYILQYFIFDKSGDDILEADAYTLDNETQVNDLAEELKTTFLNLKKTDKEWKDLGLVLTSNTENGKVLYNSREEN